MAMFETTIVLKPRSEWRPGMTHEALVDSMDVAIRFAGVTNSWTMPIKGRIDMLATGIRTPVGVKIFGPELPVLERLAKEAAQEVLDRQRSRTLPPMNPAERRIIHVTLVDNKDVLTESQGKGFFKRVTISPAMRRPRGFDRY